jgi:hypothetical protein
MKLKKEHRYINLTNEEIPVSLGKIYSDRGHGGLAVRSIESDLNGYTKVEYIKKDGSFGWYDAITYDLCEPDPLEKMIFKELFEAGFTGLVRETLMELEYEYSGDEDFFGGFVGYFNMGDPVGFMKSGDLHGYVVSSNGHYLHSNDGNEQGKVEIEYVDQSGNIIRSCYMGRYVYSLESSVETLRKGLENFGYVFDKECMRIKKKGDLVLPIPNYSLMWKNGDKVRHLHSGKVGEIDQVSYDTATVQFEESFDIVNLRDLLYVENYGG